MGSAVGGYMPRKERMQRQPAKPDGIPRCGLCHARSDLPGFYIGAGKGMMHLCKEVTYGTYVPPIRIIPLTGEG